MMHFFFNGSESGSKLIILGQNKLQNCTFQKTTDHKSFHLQINLFQIEGKSD